MAKKPGSLTGTTLEGPVAAACTNFLEREKERERERERDTERERGLEQPCAVYIIFFVLAFWGCECPLFPFLNFLTRSLVAY